MTLTDLTPAADPTAPPELQGLPPSLTIRPWPDDVVDVHGFDPRADYVERFWLGVLGPSTLWFLRRVASGLDRSPAGFDLDVADTAQALGIAAEKKTLGKTSIFARTVDRTVKFGMARRDPDGSLAVRRRLPPLAQRHLMRLPASVQIEHDEWRAEQLELSPVEHLRRRARRLALTLIELGEGRDESERQLHRWRFHPALAYEAAAWAWAKHLEAANAVD